MLRFAAIALLLSATPAFAAVDRETAITNLANLYTSVDACSLMLSRVKIDAYRDSVKAADDTLFNVDVFRATHALFDQQKSWSKDQTDTFCQTAKTTAHSLGVELN